ncbi:fumarylacetoacetate hydrolase family protein [Nitratireductor basaltis]|uniref:Fumarylacetoacetate (FAA) hydrolase n=1 Tax=Nitratireductor basaltis TaxID=472175 RepID=A0A084UA39_9HYPH|nr:fumarylacetoacetate hydrolase family protein [Nitratireductor basaltis]KFB09825.1 Fumarylacetoacetate (FAA) hydrolase [Nitratireductor basaltis]
MTAYAINPPETPSIAIEGDTKRFPVRRVFCVGRNYAAHAREMGADPDREPPFIFMKPADAVSDDGGTIPYPPLTQDLHHEIELVIAIGEGGSNIPAAQALGHVWGYGVGLDMTRRDLQAEAKKKGRPWDWAKGFDNSAICAALKPVSDTGHPESGRIWLNVNGALRQEGDLSDQIWKPAEIIAFCSQSISLAPGDLILTGTPEGVGATVEGDRLNGGIDGVGAINITIGARKA